MTMKYDTKCPTTGNRTACNKATPPPLTQEILFARKLKKVAARRETLSTKSNKKLSYALLKTRGLHMTEDANVVALPAGSGSPGITRTRA